MASLQCCTSGRHIGPEVRLLLSLCLVSIVSVSCSKTSPSTALGTIRSPRDGVSYESDSGDRRGLTVKREASNLSENKTTQCFVTCSAVKQRPVCASDGVTYSLKCELRRLRECDKKDVRFVAKGRCPGETKCQEDRRTAKFDLSQRPGQDIFIPECKTDGSYVEKQCHDGTGYCWCVTANGKPIVGSSAEGNNIDCKKFGRNKPRRIYNGGPKRRRGAGGKSCSPFERSLFNLNLIRRFNEEYARIPRQSQQPQTTTTMMTTTTDSTSKTTGAIGTTVQCQSDAESCAHRKVVEWKFSELDVDRDSELKRKELNTLRYLVNKIVEPQACAVTFLDYCDWDKNKKITLQEWTKCLRVVHITTNATGSGQQSVSQRSKGSHLTTQKQQGSSRPNPRVKPGPSSKTPKVNNNNNNNNNNNKGVDHRRVHSKSTFYGLKSKTKNSLTSTHSRTRLQDSDEKENNQHGQGSSESSASRLRPCEDKHQKAKEMDRADPDGHIFIPQCEPNGLFKKAQCHNSTGYCWCVDDNTGMPIPGISTHNATPDCSDIKTNSLKGCPFATKKLFLTELLDQITQEMVERANNGTSTSQLDEPDPEQSIEERAVRWKLTAMDVNHNSVLEKGEVKEFREEIKKVKADDKFMRKCRRNFLPYCDENSDSKITMDEWVNCMGLNEQQRNLPENPKRRGKNPFSDVLS